MVALLLLLGQGVARAEVETSCKGNIASVQGEGMVARSYRFEVERVAGTDLQEILGKCRKIAAEKQARMSRKNPGPPFRRFADLELECRKGGESFTVKRSIPVD